MKKLRDPHLRYQTHCCGTCRYYRLYESRSWTSECLLLGRTLGISNTPNDFFNWEMNRVCDFWKKRPKRWSKIAYNNPHWEDKYISRESLARMSKRLNLTK